MLATAAHAWAAVLLNLPPPSRACCSPKLCNPATSMLSLLCMEALHYALSLTPEHMFHIMRTGQDYGWHDIALSQHPPSDAAPPILPKRSAGPKMGGDAHRRSWKERAEGAHPIDPPFEPPLLRLRFTRNLREGRTIRTSFFNFYSFAPPLSPSLSKILCSPGRAGWG